MHISLSLSPSHVTYLPHIISTLLFSIFASWPSLFDTCAYNMTLIFGDFQYQGFCTWSF